MDLNKNIWNGVDEETLNAVQGVDSPFPPGSPLHDKLVLLVRNYAEHGYAVTSRYIDEYQKVDYVNDGFMPADDVDRIRKMDDPRKSEAINVVVPMISSHRAMFLTAMHRAFFSGPHFHRYLGAGTPERAAKARLCEKLMARQGQWFKERRAADLHWGHAFDYGRSFMWGKWSKKMAPKLVNEFVDENLAAILQSQGLDYMPGDTISFVAEEEEIRAEGTKWIPLDNYQVLTDGATDPDNFAHSRFFGWVDDVDVLTLLEQEPDPEEGLFNVEALYRLVRSGSGSSTFYRDHHARSGRMDNRDEDTYDDRQHKRNCHVVYMFCKIIPREWGLSDSKKPECWFLAVGGDRVLIKAEKVENLFGGMPVVCTAPAARGLTQHPTSNLMQVMGQQIAVDVLVKRHLDYLDLVQNGKFIFDPTMIDWQHIRKGGGPMGIPMKKRAMGKDINTFYHQIKVDPITGNTWNDVNAFIAMAKEGNGMTEEAGNLPERPTAQGIAAIEGRSVSRMARLALIIDEQSRQPMAYQNMCNTAQWMEGEVMLDILGKDDDLIRQAYMLPPEATGLLVGHFDIDPHFDVIPLANISHENNTSAMTEFMKTFMGVPGVMEHIVQRFNFEEIFTNYFREMGVSDIDWYRYNIQPTADAAVMQGVQAGNLVPINQAMAGAGQQQPVGVPA